MTRCRLLNIIALCLFFSCNLFAEELITIETTNGIFKARKEEILRGPDGYLKSALSFPNIFHNNLTSTGSLFANVDEKSMRLALSYIRYKNIDYRSLRSSTVLMKDFRFLFPGVELDKVTRLWECAAYCDYDRTYRVKFISTTHKSPTTAWRNLGSLCAGLGKQAYLVSQKIHKQDDHLHVLASLGNSCVRISKKIKAKRQNP